MSETWPKRVGFVGMGIMGRPMAANVLRGGYPVTVWNRTAARCAEVVAAGARQAASPAELARECDVAITIVSDTPDVEAVLFGPDGVAEGLSAGKVVIDMSTISPAATERFAVRLAGMGVALLDAPVSGGEVGAREGTLAIMVGGRAEVVERCRLVLECMGRTIVHTGPNGAGQKTKIVNQVLCALHVLAMVEGMRLAREGGLDPHMVQSVVSKGSAGSWMLSHLAPRMIDGDYAPGFMIRLQQKDLRLAREWIESLELDCPGTALTWRLFTEAVERGLGRQGTQGLVNLFR